MRLIYFGYLILNFIFTGCQSVLDIESYSSDSTYEFSSPSSYYLTSSDSSTIYLSLTSGDSEGIDTTKITQENTGNSVCDFSIAVEDDGSFSINLYNCTGDGRLKLIYGNAVSESILISNNGGTVFSGVWDVRVSSDGTYAYAVDYSIPSLVKIEIATGIRETIHSPDIGSGDKIASPTSIYLNADNTQAYIVSTYGDALYKVNLSSGEGVIVSDNSDSGTSFSYPTRAAVDSTETYAYVIDRSLKVIFQVDLSDGSRTVLQDDSGTNISAGKGYAIEIAGDDDTLYYADRDTNILYSYSVSTKVVTIVAQNEDGDDYNIATPHGLTWDPLDQNYLYLLNTSGNDYILKVDIRSGEKTLITRENVKGEGIGLYSSLGLGISPDGKTLFVADTNSTRECVSGVEISSGNQFYLSK